MESHQKNDSANGKMLYYLSENLRYPKDLESAKCVAAIPIENAYESFVEANIQIAGDSEEIHEVEVLAPYKHLELAQPEYEIQVTREKVQRLLRYIIQRKLAALRC